MTLFANFDGAMGTVVASGYLGIPAAEDRSVSFWLRTTQPAGTICWWGNDLLTNPEDGEQCRVRLTRGFIELFGRGSFTRSSTTVNDENFHHIAITWTKSTARQGHDDFAEANIYIDGILRNGKVRGGARFEIQPDGSERTDLSIRTVEQEQLVIGARPAVNGFYDFYQGDLDEFALYRDVMSSGTISGAYNGGVRGADLNAFQGPALQLWYRMGDAAGDVVPSGTLPFGTFIDEAAFYNRNAVVSSGVTISG